MASSRVFRFVEGSLVVLFMIQAARVAFAILLNSLDRALTSGQVDPILAASHLVLIMMLVLPWFTPRSRTALPRFLLMFALACAAARLAMAVPLQVVQLFASLVTLGLSGVYLASLLRANRRTWVTILIIGFSLEQLLRALNSYDLTLLPSTNLPVGDLRLRMPVIALQAGIFVLAVAVSIAARRTARSEPYLPGYLPTLSGAAFGGFLALEFLLLNLPNVVARWANVPYQTTVPLLLLTTSLPLIPGVREFVGQSLGTFEERLQGWVWLFLLLLMLIVGNRLIGLGAAAALVTAQFIAITLLWWVPTTPERDEIEQVGPSLSLALFLFTALIYAYHLSFGNDLVPQFVSGQALIPILAAAALLGIPRLFWREVDPWTEHISVARSLPAAFVAPAVVFALMLGSSRAAAAAPTLGDLRVATYNINNGYDEHGVFQLELAAKTIEASVADVVLLQGVDTGSPTSYGVDEAVYLAKRLGMYENYLSMDEHIQGIAVLSRWPLTDVHAVALDDPLKMGAVRVRVTDSTTQRTLDLMSAELTPMSDEQMRLQQLAYVFSLVDSSVPVVLGIDLGTGTGDVAYRELTAVSFLDPDTALGIERGFTYPSSAPAERRDFVLVRGLIPLESRHVESAASSHRLVVVALKWP